MKVIYFNFLFFRRLKTKEEKNILIFVSNVLGYFGLIILFIYIQVVSYESIESIFYLWFSFFS